MAIRDYVLIKPDEFDRRMGIKKSARYNWIHDGILIRGQHFLKIGGKVYFRWHAGLPCELDEISRNLKTLPPKNPGPEKVKLRQKGPNWDY